jgi:hypothetical protein
MTACQNLGKLGVAPALDEVQLTAPAKEPGGHPKRAPASGPHLRQSTINDVLGNHPCHCQPSPNTPIFMSLGTLGPIGAGTPLKSQQMTSPAPLRTQRAGMAA